MTSHDQRMKQITDEAVRSATLTVRWATFAVICAIIAVVASLVGEVMRR